MFLNIFKWTFFKDTKNVTEILFTSNSMIKIFGIFQILIINSFEKFLRNNKKIIELRKYF